jgi:trk system potassium uptake protein TrkA
VLDSAGISNAQVLAAVTGDDDTNLVIASIARFEFGVPRIIGRVNNPKNVWLFNAEMGVDVGLNQADILGHLIAEEMSLGDMMTLLKVRRGEYSLIEEKVHPKSRAASKALRDVTLPEECTIVAIIREGELVIPRGDVIFQPADEVLALVHSKSLAKMNALLGPSDPLRG